MKTLVHYDALGEDALGIWWVNQNDEPECLYVNDQSPEAARGKTLVFGKTNPEVTWVEWFDLLTERPPYFEVWGVYDSQGLSPERLLDTISG